MNRGVHRSPGSKAWQAYRLTAPKSPRTPARFLLQPLHRPGQAGHGTWAARRSNGEPTPESSATNTEASPSARDPPDPPPPPPKPPPGGWKSTKGARQLVRAAWEGLQPVVWPAAWLFIVQTLMIMLVDRFTHRVINEAFLHFASGKFTASQIGPLWWLSTNPAVTSFGTGYNWISYATALITFPLVAAANCICICALYRLAASHMGLPLSNAPTGDIDTAADAVASASGAGDVSPSAADSTWAIDSGLSTESAGGPAAAASFDGTGSVPSMESATTTNDSRSFATVLSAPEQAAPERAQETRSTGAMPGAESHSDMRVAPAVEDQNKKGRVASLLRVLQAWGQKNNNVDPVDKRSEEQEASPAPSKSAPKESSFQRAFSSSKQGLQLDFRRMFHTAFLVSIAEFFIIHLSNLFILAPLLVLPLIAGWQLALPLTFFYSVNGREALDQSYHTVRAGKMTIAIALALSMVFALELIAPFLPYAVLGLIPVRVIGGVPELVCISLISTQGAVCVLAQMRYVLPLVLLSMSPLGESPSQESGPELADSDLPTSEA